MSFRTSSRGSGGRFEGRFGVAGEVLRRWTMSESRLDGFLRPIRGASQAVRGPGVVRPASFFRALRAVAGSGDNPSRDQGQRGANGDLWQTRVTRWAVPTLEGVYATAKVCAPGAPGVTRLTLASLAARWVRAWKTASGSSLI